MRYFLFTEVKAQKAYMCKGVLRTHELSFQAATENARKCAAMHECMCIIGKTIQSDLKLFLIMWNVDRQNAKEKNIKIVKIVIKIQRIHTSDERKYTIYTCSAYRLYKGCERMASLLIYCQFIYLRICV